MVINPDRSKRRILFVNPRLGGGGAERVIVNLLRGLDPQKFSLTLAVVDTRDAIFLREIPPQVTVVDLQAVRVRNALGKIMGLIYRTRPDIVFSTLNHLNVGLAITKALWPRGVKLCIRPTVVISDTLRENRKGAKLWYALFRWFMTRADGFVFQSEALHRDFVATLGVDVDNCWVIRNPIDTEAIRQQADESAGPDLPKDRFNIVAAGRLAPQKGFDILLEAMAKLGAANAHLTILGEGEERNSLEETARRLGIVNRISLAGFQKNPYTAIRRADLFVLSSRYEGFPNVMLEALACGTPVVASDLPGVGDLLKSIPGSALFPAGDAAALATAIQEAIRTPAPRVPADAVSAFDVTAICAQYEAAFLRLAKNVAR